MSALPALVLLQAEPGGGILSFLPFILIFLIFYFLLIRPQQKRQQKQESMLKAIEKGDSVVTAGGIHGKVTGVTDDVLTRILNEETRKGWVYDGITFVHNEASKRPRMAFLIFTRETDVPDDTDETPPGGDA